MNKSNTAPLFTIFLLILLPLCAIAQEDIGQLTKKLRETKDSYTKAHTSIQLSKGYMTINLDSAMHYGTLAIEYAETLQEDSLLATAYQTVGNSALYAGNFDFALESYINAANQFPEGKYPHISQAIMNNMGVVFDRKAEYKKAREYYLKSKVYLDQIKQNYDSTKFANRASKLFSNIGATFESEGNTGEAMEYYVKGLNISEKHQLLQQQAVIYSNIGSLYLHAEKYELAGTNYKESLKIYDSLHNKTGIALMKMHLGELYYQQNELEKSKQILKESAQIAKEAKSTSTIYYASKILHEIYARQGDYAAAYTELALYKTLNDSLFNLEKTKALERLEIEYLFQTEKNKMLEEQKRQALWNYGLGGAIVLLMVIFVLLFRNITNKARIANLNNEYLELTNKHLSLEKLNLEEKLEFKNKELTTNVMYLMKNNEFINSVSERLQAMKGKFKKDNQKDINRITLDLQKAAQNDVWEDFETHFNQVHSQFYENLSIKHPDLSPNERKLCAFLRLNLSTKEISSITMQLPNTIQVARTRLRKKLGLDSSENIISYLGTI